MRCTLDCFAVSSCEAFRLLWTCTFHFRQVNSTSSCIVFFFNLLGVLGTVKVMMSNLTTFIDRYNNLWCVLPFLILLSNIYIVTLYPLLNRRDLLVKTNSFTFEANILLIWVMLLWNQDLGKYRFVSLKNERCLFVWVYQGAYFFL